MSKCMLASYKESQIINSLIDKHESMKDETPEHEDVVLFGQDLKQEYRSLKGQFYVINSNE